MINETDLSQEKAWFYEQLSEKVINKLQKRNIDARYISGRQEALSVITAMIPPGAVVARGDSVSLDQVGIIPELEGRNQNTIINPFERDSEGFYIHEPEERLRLQKETFFADVYLTGTNAVTQEGRLVNIDGRGNRVAAMIFGPSRVIVVAGANKIVKDVDEALERIHKVAAPLNAKRHALKHHHEEMGDLPCARTGICTDCNHDYRICRYTVIIEGAMFQQKGRITVILIGEELGI